MMEITLESNPYLARFEAMEKSVSGEPAWLAELRRSAVRRFSELGFPTTRDEEYRFTNLSAIAKTAFEPLTPGDGDWTVEKLEAAAFGGTDVHRIVFVNGRYSAALSSVGTVPAGVRIESLAAALKNTPAEVEKHLGRIAAWENHAFAALNTAFFGDGLFLSVPDGITLDRPVHVIHATSPGTAPGLCHPRSLITVGRSANVTVVQSRVGGAGVYWTNAVTEIAAGENANVDHYELQLESTEAYHTSLLQMTVGRSGVISNHAYAFGGSLVRNDANVHLGGEGAHGAINGLYVVNGTQHVDNHTGIDHATPHCTSHELYKGVLDGKARSVFNGRILVRKDAQKTDSKQTNKNLLLSKEALVNTNPQLEIYADDVKCTHGATIGQLDPTGLFYLQSRGISRDQARHILTYAFAGDLVDRVKVPGLKERLDQLLAERLRDNVES